MPRKRKILTFAEKMLLLKKSGVNPDVVVSESNKEWESMESLDQRLQNILAIVKNQKKETGRMIFFVMYDIESDKVRHQVSKYLIKSGCFRVQHSVFLADLTMEKYRQIRDNLTEVQACYDNHDSILVVPVSTELLNSMKVIGKSIDVDIITHTRNTLFF